jgi:N-acetylmuramic acid 6-phosphate etherase
MVDMQLSNQKLVERGTKMLMKALDIEENAARELLLREGSVRKSMEAHKTTKN